VNTENPSACATVNWKVCKSVIVLYYLYLSVIKRTSNKSNHRTRTHKYWPRQPTRDIILSTYILLSGMEIYSGKLNETNA
jgi:hypothetical protein